MQRRFRVAVAALLVLLAGILLWWFVSVPRLREPRYAGKPLRSWLPQLPQNPNAALSFTPDEAQAVRAIRRMGESAVPLLTHMLTNAQPSLSIRAFTLLNRYLHIPVTLTTDQSAGVLAAFEILGPRANSAVPALTRALNGPPRTIQEYLNISLALGTIGPEGRGVLRQELSSTNSDLLWAIAWALRHFQMDDPATVNCLITTGTNDPGRSTLCLGVLSDFKARSDMLLPFFIAQANSPSVDTRKAALQGLGKFGQASEAVMSVLKTALQSPNNGEFQAAVRALSEFGPRAQGAEPDLLNILQSIAKGRGKFFVFHLLGPGKVTVFWRDVYGQTSFTEQERIRAVAYALEQTDPEWRNKLPPGLATGPTLQDWLALGTGVEARSNGPSLQQWLLMARGEQPQYEGRPLRQWLEGYIEAISGLEPLNRFTAERLATQKAVQDIGTNAIPWLLSWVQSTNRQDTRLARSGFSFLGGKGCVALDALMELAQSPVPEMRSRAYSCVHALGLEWNILWPAIVPVLHDNDASVREGAAEFLLDCYPMEVGSTGLPEFLPARQ